MSDRKIKLRANDAEDLAVIAALLQDARTHVREMVFQAEDGRFMAAFRRYRREAQAEWTDCDNLTECDTVLVFEKIKQVRYRGLDPEDPDQKVQLLTIATSPGKDAATNIELVMAGTADIRLASDVIECRLDDFGTPQPAEEPPCDHFAEQEALLERREEREERVHAEAADGTPPRST